MRPALSIQAASDHAGDCSDHGHSFSSSTVGLGVRHPAINAFAVTLVSFVVALT